MRVSRSRRDWRDKGAIEGFERVGALRGVLRSICRLLFGLGLSGRGVGQRGGGSGGIAFFRFHCTRVSW